MNEYQPPNIYALIRDKCCDYKKTKESKGEKNAIINEGYRTFI
ncbi:hypothetical protein GCM10011351_28220 [Paraliobacillus quinghaiensis]|uniref:Uncharacterized protein n=1 Tax=Paraliobacillus quinghaiensis TaxID=470815 RepID=A0A917TVK6_9BACI|nr:hypothetical protein GCM10011351_28220 [Paraliobacillus quinghaiensis]